MLFASYLTLHQPPSSLLPPPSSLPSPPLPSPPLPSPPLPSPPPPPLPSPPLPLPTYHPQTPPVPVSDAVPSGDVTLSILAHKIFKTQSEWDKREYEQKLMQELQVHVYWPHDHSVYYRYIYNN